ncbi:MAG: thiamine-phosphate kinase [Candidatus Omnitrophota bacterium]|nr:thiamine-phosphate kinase [Candidatus Omnitrophota bacterium]
MLKELEWVDFLKEKVKKGKDVLVGIGDDCALVKIGKENVLLKSDLFIEGVHFPAIGGSAFGGKQKKISFKTIGMRAVARVLSDFAACGGIPKFIGVSAGVPSHIKEKQLIRILAGILYYGKKYNFSLVGGDTAKSSKLFLDIWGIATAKKFIKRSSARVGDYIFITGRLGMRKFCDAFEPRIEIAQYLIRNFKINAMIDISDGFILDLYRILKESKKGAIVYKENIPVTKGELDFYRGEDYELIFTVDQNESRIEHLKKKFYHVGVIKSRNFGYKMQIDSRVYKIEPKGYLHF